MKQNKKTITEVQLRDIVAESVKRVLNERQGTLPQKDKKYNERVNKYLDKNYSLNPSNNELYRDYGSHYYGSKNDIDDIYLLNNGWDRQFVDGRDYDIVPILERLCEADALIAGAIENCTAHIGTNEEKYQELYNSISRKIKVLMNSLRKDCLMKRGIDPVYGLSNND